MPKTQGQTDQVLKLKLPSSIVRTGWGRDAVAQGGKIPLEVWTHWVADRSEIDIAIKDLEGQIVETVKGHMVSDLFRVLYPVTKPNKTGGMYFEAELHEHSIKAVGPKVKVWPAVQWSDLKWVDEKGKEVSEIAAGAKVELTAQIKGAQEGDRAALSLFCRTQEHRPASFKSFSVEIESGQVRVDWKVSFPGKFEDIPTDHDVSKYGLDYFQPVYSFEAFHLGVKKMSQELKLNSWIAFNFGPAQKRKMARKAIFEFPDGTKKEISVPEDGYLNVKTAVPGPVLFKGFSDN